MKASNFFILLLLLSQAVTTQASVVCSDLFAEKLYSVDRLTIQVKKDSQNLTQAELISYSYADYYKLRGKILDYTYMDQGSNSPISVENTEILSLQDLSKNRRTLVKNLAILQNLPKFRRKQKYQEYEESLHKVLETVMESKIEEHSIENLRSPHEGLAYNNSSAVEVGVFLIILKDGTSLATIHTSSTSGKIKSSVLGRGLHEISKKNETFFADIASLEYFHIHSRHLPLSAEDIALANGIKESYERNGYKIKIHMNAIMNFDGKLLVSHYSE